MKFDVVGLGNALLDYQVEVPFEFLKELGVQKNSMTLVDTPTQKDAIQKIKDQFHRKTKTTSGGCAANTLAGLGSFGGKGFFFGKVGADDHGRHYRDDLEKIGVKTHLVESPDDATGTCLALITPDAERTMLTHLGVATSLSEADILAEPIRDSKILYIEGYLWDSPSARMASMKAMDIAKAAGKKVSFTFSDSFCVERHLQDFLTLAQDRIDILFCNEFEAVKATHTSDPRQAFKMMKDWADIVCVTLGPQGALLSHRSERIQEDLATWDVKLVDKLGAGDLFASGVLYGLTHSKSLKECGYLGSYAATRIIQQMGARLKSSLADEIPKAVTGPSSPESTRRLTA